MLKGVIEQDNVRPIVAEGQPAGFEAIFTNHNRYIFQAAGNFYQILDLWISAYHQTQIKMTQKPVDGARNPTGDDAFPIRNPPREIA